MTEYDKLSLPYDPELKEAMLEIQEIMEKHKIGGNVCLSSKTHSEFLYHFPDWSIVQLDKATPEGQMVKISYKEGDIEEEVKTGNGVMTSSIHLIMRGRDMAEEAFNVYTDIMNHLKKSMTIEHKTNDNFTPHTVH